MIILDTMFAPGHVNFNKYYIKIILKYYNLKVTNNTKYYNYLKKEKNVELFELSPPNNNRLEIIKSFFRMRREKIFCNKDEKVLVMGYDTVTFFVFFLLCKPQNKDIYVIHHHNIDELTNRIKKMIFYLYKDNIKHIVLDKSFINEFSRDCNVKNIFYLPHYLPRIKKQTSMKLQEMFLVGLSNSNSDEYVKQIIDLDKNGLLSSVKYKVVLKAHSLNYESDMLKVINEFIPDEEFNYYFEHAKAIILMFPKTYKLRFSASILESIANDKIVIVNNIFFANEMKKRYPNNILIYEDINNLFKELGKVLDREFNHNEKNKMIEQHNDSIIQRKLIGILNE